MSLEDSTGPTSSSDAGSGSEGDNFETPPRTPMIELEDPHNETINKEDVEGGKDSDVETIQEVKKEDKNSSKKQQLSSSSTSTSPPFILTALATTTATKDSTPSIIIQDNSDEVAKLKSQILDLTSQVTSLNSKLVDGYTRLGDLEDEFHETKQSETRLKSKLTELEKEKLERDKALETGGWVERDHVQGEMQRLMTKVLEETKSKETALEAHLQLETELENLTSSLFTEANRMVAVERFARARAEEKMRTLEESATDMAGMFGELQVNLRDKVEKFEEKDGEVGDLRRRLALANGGVATPEEEETQDDPFNSTGVLFSDGNSVTAAHNALTNITSSPSAPIGSPSLSSSQKHNRKSSSSPHVLSTAHTLTTVIPYQEFLSFITYLRQLRITVLTKPPDYPSGFPNPYISNTTITSRSFSSTSTQPIATTSSSNSPTASTSNLPPLATPAQLLSSYLPLSSHLSQAFLKRCINEDTDPTLRLDLSPGLGFLSRRSIQSSILDGNLIIEPLIHGNKINSSNCTLCGCDLTRWWRGEGEMLFSGREEREAAHNSSLTDSGSSEGGLSLGLSLGSTSSQAGRTVKNVGGSMLKAFGSSAWGFGSSSGMGKRNSASGTSTPTTSTSTPIVAELKTGTSDETGLGMNLNPSISISTSSPSSTTSLPLPITTSPPKSTSLNSDPKTFAFPLLPSQQIHLFRASETSSTRYAICPTYCLNRLRSVCEFWNYVRVVERGLLLEEGFRFAGRERERKKSTRKEKEMEKKVEEPTFRNKVGGGEEGEIIATFAGADEETEGEEKKVVEAVEEVKELNPDEVEEEKSTMTTEAHEVPLPTSPIVSPDSPIVISSPIISNPEASASTTSLSNSTSTTTSKTGIKPIIPPRRSGTRPQTPIIPNATLTEVLSSSTSSVNLVPESTTTSTEDIILPLSEENQITPSSPSTSTTIPATTTTTATTSNKASTSIIGTPKLPPRKSGKKSDNLVVAGNSAGIEGGIEGSAGWEDRCWMEVVRLKERMFWSRITGSE